MSVIKWNLMLAAVDSDDQLVSLVVKELRFVFRAVHHHHC
jgi:hypothetical protein